MAKVLFNDEIGLEKGLTQVAINNLVRETYILGRVYAQGVLEQKCENFGVFRTLKGYTQSVTWYDLYIERHTIEWV